MHEATGTLIIKQDTVGGENITDRDKNQSSVGMSFGTGTLFNFSQ